MKCTEKVKKLIEKKKTIKTETETITVTKVEEGSSSSSSGRNYHGTDLLGLVFVCMFARAAIGFVLSTPGFYGFRGAYCTVERRSSKTVI